MYFEIKYYYYYYYYESIAQASGIDDVSSNLHKRARARARARRVETVKLARARARARPRLVETRLNGASMTSIGDKSC